MPLKFIKQLGVGGFGIVEQVEDENGKQFARKTFSLNQTLTAEMAANVKKRFIREAKVQQGFVHKNIVPVLGGDLDADPPFYLMPVAVSTLADEIRKDRTLDGKFVSAFSDVVAALEELHGLEIFHRDVKPQNVLRLGSGEDTYYAVSDFGLISQKDSTLSKLTTTGMAKGSDYFTAPEITSDLRKASIQSDIFSLGCILHEMVGTKLEFRAKRFGKMATTDKFCLVAPETMQNVDSDQCVQSWMRWCLSIQPQQLQNLS